jgi:NAD(P) transhydrogenase subunit beta
MIASMAALAYLAAGVLFILSLRGLSNPETSRRGNAFGMVGMAIAVGVTLITLWISGALDLITAGLILGGVVVGGGAGALIAGRVQMTQMPQLVAAFHSLVGLAACLVAVGAVYAPESFGIATEGGGIKTLSIVELSLGVAIGAITFTGSVIAFAKLNGNMSGAPILLPARHLINVALALALVLLIGILIGTEGSATWAFWGVFILALVLGATLIIPIGGADMPVVVSMLNSYSGWAAAALGFTLENIALIITGALVGSSGAILSYIMCKGMNRSRRRSRGDQAGQAGLGGGRRLHPEECLEGDHRPWLRHGRGPGPACATGDGGQAEGGGGGGEVRHPSRGRTHARSHERPAR